MDPLVTMNRSEFTRLEGVEIFKHIFPQNLTKIAGKVGGGDQEYKRRLVGSLTRGQRSIFMFMAVYFHNIGWDSFLTGFSDDIDKGFLDEIAEGLEYIGDHRLRSMILRCKELHTNSMDAARKREVYAGLDREYEAIKEESRHNAMRYIKSHADEFFDFQTNQGQTHTVRSQKIFGASMV